MWLSCIIVPRVAQEEVSSLPPDTVRGDETCATKLVNANAHLRDIRLTVNFTRQHGRAKGGKHTVQEGGPCLARENNAANDTVLL